MRRVIGVALCGLAVAVACGGDDKKKSAGSAGNAGTAGRGGSAGIGGSAGSSGAGGSDAGYGGREAGSDAASDAQTCVPTSPSTEVCDDVDNDCNGQTDEVDVGGDGLIDCLSIGLFGTAGTFPSSNFAAWLEENGVTVRRFHTGAVEPLDAALIADLDLVILDYLTRAYTPTEASALATWVAAGGGVMSMTGYSGAGTDIDRPNGLLAPYGIAYIPGLHTATVGAFATHPTTFGLSAVTFNGGFLVGLLQPDGGLVPAEGGAPNPASLFVASIPAGNVAVAHQHGSGRVFVWGDEWVQFDSEWAALPEIKQFWINVTGWLAGYR